MANKGGRGHIKRLNAPKYLSIHRKEHKYTIRQNPGRHTLQKSIPLTILLEKMQLAENRSEANRIIRNGAVGVNSKVVKEPKYPIGLNDLIAIGDGKYVLTINERGQILIGKEETKKMQVYKVVGKYKYKSNIIMARLHDGSTIKSNADVKVNDSVSISNKKINGVIKFDKGSNCEVIDGVHVGKIGKITAISTGNMHKEKSVVIEQKNGSTFETLVKNIIVVE